MYRTVLLVIIIAASISNMMPQGSREPRNRTSSKASAVTVTVNLSSSRVALFTALRIRREDMAG
ncbi:MAG: hypothetical protein GQ567_02375 [Methanosarcinales archaeon]|nr:hypothetical protein [Methanosarcinales archaeon]